MAEKIATDRASVERLVAEASVARVCDDDQEHGECCDGVHPALFDTLAAALTALLAERDALIREKREPKGWMALGKPAIPMDDGEWIPRCIKCGIPRGTLRHALRCTAGLCDDPYPDALKERDALRAKVEQMEVVIRPGCKQPTLQALRSALSSTTPTTES